MNQYHFFDENGILGENDRVILRQIKEEEFPLFCKILGEGKKEDRAAYQTEAYMEQFRGEMAREDAFYCAIVRKSDDAFCGYIGIAELLEQPWEFAIELFKIYHRQGLGYASLMLFMESIKERTGVNVFKSCVEGLNHGSQKLMEKAKGNLTNIERGEDGTPVMVYEHII